MKFGHLADCHLGSWRNPKLRELNLESFRRAINICVKERVAFILICGDLFDTSLPNIDILKEVTDILKELYEKDISVYIIPGSHDFSPSGKTMIDVLEKAGLVENVMKFKEGKLVFTEDKTGVKITGIFGKKGGLEVGLYKDLRVDAVDGFKIFMFHSVINELKGKDKVEGISMSLLPKGFDYYAGGHVHVRNRLTNAGYPGPIFPNNFKELEELKFGSFNIVEVLEGLKIFCKNLDFFEIVSFDVDLDGLDVEEANKKLASFEGNFSGKVVTLRVRGVLSSGKVSDLNFFDFKDAIVLKNTSGLSSREFKELEVEEGEVDDIEERLVEEYASEISKDKDYLKELVECFSLEKEEGEKNVDFEGRVLESCREVLGLKRSNFNSFSKKIS